MSASTGSCLVVGGSTFVEGVEGACLNPSNLVGLVFVASAIACPMAVIALYTLNFLDHSTPSGLEWQTQ